MRSKKSLIFIIAVLIVVIIFTVVVLIGGKKDVTKDSNESYESYISTEAIVTSDAAIESTEYVDEATTPYNTEAVELESTISETYEVIEYPDEGPNTVGIIDRSDETTQHFDEFNIDYMVLPRQAATEALLSQIERAGFDRSEVTVHDVYKDSTPEKTIYVLSFTTPENKTWKIRVDETMYLDKIVVPE